MVKHHSKLNKETSKKGDDLLFQLGKSMAPDEARFQSRLTARLNQKSVRPMKQHEITHTGWFNLPMGQLAYASVFVIAVLFASFYFIKPSSEKPIANVIAHLGTTNISQEDSQVVMTGDLIETQEDGQTSLLLSDHSIVRIDHLSSAKISKSRHITLYQGRLYAEVAKTTHADSFQIRTQNVEVTVLGTAFEVESTETGVSVKVTEGQVKVSWNNDEFILNTGEAINITNQDDNKAEKFALRYSPQWIEKLIQSEASNPIVQAMRKHFPSRSLNLNGSQ